MMFSDQMPEGFTHKCDCGTFTKASKIIPNKPPGMCASCFTAQQWTLEQVAVNRMTDAINMELALDQSVSMLAEAATEIANLDGTDNPVFRRIGTTMRTMRERVTRGVESTMAVEGKS